MSRTFRRVICLVAVWVACPPTLRAEPPPDPLRFFPESTVAVGVIEKPQALVDYILDYLSWPEVKGLEGVKEVLDSTNVRRFMQLVGHLERELGQPWSSWFPSLTRHGMALGALPRAGSKDAAVVGVIQGDNAKLTEKFRTLLIDLAAQELARQESPDRYVSRVYRGVTAHAIEKKFYVVVLDSALVFSNHGETLKQIVDRYQDQATTSVRNNPRLAQAMSSRGKDCAAWGWLDVRVAKYAATGELPEGLRLPGNDPIPLVLLGGYFDVVRRADWMLVDLAWDGPDVVLNARLNAGRKSLHEAVAGHVYPAGEPGCLPLLAPPGTIYSNTFYMDMASFHQRRSKLVNEKVVKEFDEFDKRSRPVLFGRAFSELLAATGTRHRFVMATQQNLPYDIRPKTIHPSYAFVLDLRDPEGFMRMAEAPLRSIGLIGSFNFSMKLSESTHQGCKVVTYRFADNEKNRSQDAGFLFNFTPSFVRVGHRLVLSSTQELAQALVEELNQEAEPTPSADAANARHRLNWSGLGEFAKAYQGLAVAQHVMQFGGTTDDGEREFARFLRLFQRLGTAEAAQFFEPDQFRLEMRTRFQAPTKESRR